MKSVTTLNNMAYTQNTHQSRGFKLTFADWFKFNLIEELMSDFKKLTDDALGLIGSPASRI
jgi:hypothetical protein